MVPPALLLALLVSCSPGPQPSSSPTPAAARPSAPAVQESTPSPTPPPPWTQLSIRDLPEEEEDLGSFLAKSSPAVCLLGKVEEAEVTLYGLNPGHGGGVLLRDGDHLVHFDQRFWDRPELAWDDFDGDGGKELTALYLAEKDGDSPAYDLVFYRPDGDSWSACAVSHGDCAQTVLDQVDTDWNERTHTFSLSYAGQQVSRAFPDGVAPGKLVLGHLCLFHRDSTRYSVVLDAWSEVLGETLAVFRAEIVYQDGAFQLQNLRMDADAGV